MPTPGKNYEGQRGFPTPNSTPETSACRTFRVPASDEWLGLLMAAVESLTKDYNYYNWGALTPDETALAWNDILIEAWEHSFTDGCPSGIPTPYWDEDSDVDDEYPSDMQPWYGTVDDPEAPPDELTFFENAAIWTFTGFLAVATIEVGAAPAILFNTIAPRFVLATRRGDLGEIIRILVDGQEAARVDTSSYSPGDVIRTNILADPEIETHEILMVQVS